MLVPSYFPLYSTPALSGMNSHPTIARMVEKLPVPSVPKGRKMCPLQFGEFGHGKEASPGWFSLCPGTHSQAPGMAVQTSNLGGGHSGVFSRVPRE